MADSSVPKKRRSTLARQLKTTKNHETTHDDHETESIQVISRAKNIKRALADQVRSVDSSRQACLSAKRDLEDINDSQDLTEIKEKITQLSHLYRALTEKYEALFKYTIDLKASTELSIICHYQHAMTVAMGDTESASDGRDPSYSAALMSSVHRP
jgi:uncharacterized protein (DUF2252 family)